MRSSWVGLKEVLTASRKDNDRLRAENTRLLHWNHALRDALRDIARHKHTLGCDACTAAAEHADGERA